MRDVADELRSALKGREDARVALLFGSRATGRARADSDVDLAVLPGPGADLLGLAAELWEALRLEVDVVDLRRASVPLLDEVLRHGIVVHEAAPGEAAAWRSRTMFLQDLDRPLYRRMRDAWLRRLAEET